MGKRDVGTFSTAGMFVLSETAVENEPETCKLGCEDGYIPKWENGRVVGVSDCECRRHKLLADWKQRQIAEVRLVFKKFDLDNTVSDPKIPLLHWGKKWPWLMGRTGQGKTHYSGYLLKQLIQSSNKRFKWVRLTMKDFLDVLELKRSDDKGERQWAREMQERIDEADAVFMNDIDKVGNLTASRQEELYSLADTCYEKGKKLCVSSNGSIADFCMGFNHGEKALRDRDGLAPIQRRFMDLCEEIKVVRQI